MGNSNSSDHHTVLSKHHKHHHKHLRRHSIHLDPNLEDFLKLIISRLNNVDNLLKYFDNSYIIRQIFHKKQVFKTNNELDLEKTKEIFTNMFKITTSSSILELYIQLMFDYDENVDYDTVLNIFMDCFKNAMKLIDDNFNEIGSNKEYSKKSIELLINLIPFNENANGIKETSASKLKEWIIHEFPELFYCHHNWVLNKIKDNKVNNSSSHDQNTNSNKQIIDDLSHFMNKAIVWYFVCNLPLTYTKNLSSENGTLIEKLKNCLILKSWKLLYDSESHGLSLNRFQSNLANYKAPTIMFIYCSSGSLYCACSADEYRESPQAYGDENTRMFRLLKDFKIFDLNSSKNIYLNTKSRGLQLGLIFGFSMLKPILKIDEHFQHADHELCKNDQIISVEVWGCGSAKAALTQLDLKKWENKQIEKMRTAKLNPEGEWNENADKAILDLAGIKTEHSERGDF